LVSDVTDPRVASTALPDPVVDTSNQNASTAEASSNDADDFDMFADDDEHGTAKPSLDGSNVVSGPNSDAVSQPSADALNTDSDSKLLFDCLWDFQKIGTLPIKKKSLLYIIYC